MRPLLIALLLAGCRAPSQPSASASPTDGPDTSDAPVGSAGASTVTREAPGGPGPALLVAQAWFETVDGKPRPGPARLDMIRPQPWGWSRHRLEDADSNVFHKAIIWRGGVLTAGAEQALLRHWTWDGAWTARTVWRGDWPGRFDRLRDLEIGDVDGDGEDEFVLATHDYGVVAVVEQDGTSQELSRAADTFVHEIELVDVDGDGRLDIAATPSARNQADRSQPGRLVVYLRRGEGWEARDVAAWDDSHAKEVLGVDLDGDGRGELYAVVEGEVRQGALEAPVRVVRFTWDGRGFQSTEVARVQARQARCLVAGDLDGDGAAELVITTLRSGIHLLRPGAPWAVERIDADAGGYEHPATIADLDGDGRAELYVAPDDQAVIRRYTWSAAERRFVVEEIGRFEGRVIPWNLTTGTL